MEIYSRIRDIQAKVRELKAEGLSIGYVPTMGALHEGHISLLRRSDEENNISVCSIFVNPIQFNNQIDLEKYPRTLKEDSEKLDKANCDIVFAPSVDEMYPDKVSESYDFGLLEKLMEGALRPGHFNGVAVVVKRLFDICMPDKAYFGEKDFQQLMVIRALVKQENIPVKIIGCPIIREPDGLAMSSRNVRLTPGERRIAPEIFKTLDMMKEKAGKKNIKEILTEAENQLEQHPGVKIDYIQIVDESTLVPITNWDETDNIRAFVALFLGEVRLIDNMKL